MPTALNPALSNRAGMGKSIPARVDCVVQVVQVVERNHAGY